jgi:hypothetical protein
VTIRKGEPWGEVRRAPHDLRIVTDDSVLHDWVQHYRSSGTPIREVGLGGGDLARCAGGGRPGRFDGEVLAAPFDVVHVVAEDGRETWSCSHIVARRSWWRGEVAFAMTAQYLGGYDVAPRSHPNDGKVDILRVAAAMPLRVRIAARRRARTGSHLPHPQLTFTQASQADLTFARPLVIWVDGRRWGTARELHITVEPDAYTGYV